MGTTTVSATDAGQSARRRRRLSASLVAVSVSLGAAIGSDRHSV